MFQMKIMMVVRFGLSLLILESRGTTVRGRDWKGFYHHITLKGSQLDLCPVRRVESTTTKDDDSFKGT